MEIIEKKESYTSLESALSGVQDFSMHFIVLFNRSLTVGERSICDLVIFGKTVKEWVKSCSGGRGRITEIEYSNENAVIELISPYLGNETYTIVLYADTPLLRFPSIMSLVEEMNVRGQNVKKLKRGYIFNTKFIKSTTSIYAPEQSTEFDDEFFTVRDNQTFMIATNVIKQRIFAYHISNGVIILSEATTTIDAEAEIESGVIIHQNNAVLGHSYIKKGTILYPNNVIKDSYIGCRCLLKGGYIENAKVVDETIIEPFSKIVL